jgi:hypothetical protein
MSGTSIENPASDHNTPFVRNSRNCTYHAPAATRNPKRILPVREFGVVLGSEIMKNVNRSSAPLWRR